MFHGGQRPTFVETILGYGNRQEQCAARPQYAYPRIQYGEGVRCMLQHVVRDNEIHRFGSDLAELEAVVDDVGFDDLVRLKLRKALDRFVTRDEVHVANPHAGAHRVRCVESTDFEAFALAQIEIRHRFATAVPAQTSQVCLESLEDSTALHDLLDTRCQGLRRETPITTPIPLRGAGRP
jgi:hypothetical protein